MYQYWPRRSLYEGGISSRGPSFGRATHTHKLHTQVLGRLYGGGQRLPSTIVFSIGLSLPTAVVWVAFPAVRQRVPPLYIVSLTAKINMAPLYPGSITKKERGDERF